MASNDARRAHAFRLRSQGLGYQRIAEIVGVNRGTVYRWVQKHYAAWQSAQAAAESDPLPPLDTANAPLRAPQDASREAAPGPGQNEAHSGAHAPETPAYRSFVTALQATGRYDVAAALAEVDPAQVARWRVERHRELERARATLVLRNAKVLHQIAGSPDSTNRDRIAAVDRLLQWTATHGETAGSGDAPVGPQEPPVPLLAVRGPSDEHDPECADNGCTGRCDAARFEAWVERVCWARSHPGATDAVALLGAGNLVGQSDAGEWLDTGRADLDDGQESAAARFAIRWSVAVGTSISSALSAHAEALSSGAGAATRAALDTLAAICPDEYGGRGEPSALSMSSDHEQPVARILRLSLEGDLEL